MCMTDKVEPSSEFEKMFALKNSKDWDSEIEILNAINRKWFMLCRWILVNGKNIEFNLEKALDMAFENNDSATAKSVSWRIIQFFYMEYKNSLNCAMDIYPGIRCKCSKSTYKDAVFCSHDRILAVSSKVDIVGLPETFLGFQIEVYKLNDTENRMRIDSNLDEFMEINFKTSFSLKIDIPATTAEALFLTHSNLTLICPSVVKLQAFENSPIIKKEICMQLYCKHKGIIPIAEQHFCSMLHGIPTDVIEGNSELMTKLHVGDKIGPSTSTGTLAGFVRHMMELDCFLTCAHVVIEINKLLLCDYSGKLGGEVFLYRSNKRPKCGVVIWKAFDHDDPHKTSVDAALVLMQNCSLLDSNNCTQEAGRQYGFRNLQLNSPYLNDNCVDHEELCILNETKETYCLGAETGRHLSSSVTFPRQAEVDVNFSDNGNTAASVSGHNVRPLWLYQPTHVQLSTGNIAEKRVFRMYNQIALDLPLIPGDSGTGVYIVNNPNGKTGCVGMAIAFCPRTGISVVTPLKDILKRIYL